MSSDMSLASVQDEQNPGIFRDKTTTITTIGTCRIVDPIAAAERGLPVRRNLTNIYGFVHTSKEILQQIDVLEGREIPHDLVRFIASAQYAPPQSRGPSDVYIVEVSTLKEIRFRDHWLQINCFDRVFQDRRELFETFFRHKYPNERETRARALNMLPSFYTTDDTERSILLEGFVHMTSRVELAQDLHTILARLTTPVVFVCHIDVADSSGRMMESRSRLCNWMREICSEQGYTLFDPAPQVTAFGRPRALAEDGRDTNHYTADFKPVIGGMLYETATNNLARPPATIHMLTPVRAPVESAPTLPPPAPEVAPPVINQTVPAAGTAADAERAPSQEVRAVVVEAKARMGRGEMDEAEVLLRGAVIDHPGAAELFGLLGAVAYHRGDNTAALGDLQRALHLDSRAIEPRVLLVKIAQRLNRHEEACAHALELVASVPEDQKALTVAAKALLKAKRFHDAASVWRRVAVLRPELSAPLAEVARCELKGRNFEEALKAADAALAREASNATALTLKAEVLQRLKRMDDLAALALHLAVAEPAAAMALVPALTATAHHEHAAAIIAAVRRQGHASANDTMLQAGLVRSLTQRARAAMERGDVKVAANAWNAIRLIEPASPRAASGLRKLLSPVRREVKDHLLAGDLVGAIAKCVHGLDLDPGELRLLRQHAKLLEQRDDWAAAATAWESLAREEGGKPESLIRAARLATRAGNLIEALRIYGTLPDAERQAKGSTIASLTRKLVSVMRQDFVEGRLEEAVSKATLIRGLDRENIPAARLLSRAVSSYRKLYKLAVAEQDVIGQEACCRRMLAIDPNRADALRALSRLDAARGRPREAIDLLERLTRLEPEEARNWHKLASLCRTARRYDLGVPAALKAVELEPNNPQGLARLSDMLNRQALAS